MSVGIASADRYFIREHFDWTPLWSIRVKDTPRLEVFELVICHLKFHWRVLFNLVILWHGRLIVRHRFLALCQRLSGWLTSKIISNRLVQQCRYWWSNFLISLLQFRRHTSVNAIHLGLERAKWRLKVYKELIRKSLLSTTFRTLRDQNEFSWSGVKNRRWKRLEIQVPQLFNQSSFIVYFNN